MTDAIAHSLRFAKIHDLSQLLSVITPRVPNVSALSVPCIFLTDFYVETRYPVHWPVRIDRDEAQRCCEIIRQVVTTALAQK